MSRAKHRLVAALLLAFAVWPLVHYGLVQRYALDPWKFAGWAMYTGPTILPSVHVYALRSGDRVKTPLIGSRLEPAAEELARFRKARQYWGRLERPDRLAALTLQGLDSHEGLEIVIIESRLEAASARLVSTRESFFFHETVGAGGGGAASSE